MTGIGSLWSLRDKKLIARGKVNRVGKKNSFDGFRTHAVKFKIKIRNYSHLTQLHIHTVYTCGP